MNPSDLYGLPLERFIEERNQLAKQLRQDGRRDEAERVSKLRKPSVAAWAVNQLIRTQPKDFDRLLVAGDALQKAQSDLLKGRGDPAALRRVVGVERDSVNGLVKRGRGLLTSDGHELSSATLETVSETLHAAALDEDARNQVKDGCLERELRHVGLGALTAGGGGAAPRAKPQPKQPKRAPEPKPPPKSVPSVDRRAARQAEAEARRRMERAARGVHVAAERRDRAAAQLREEEEKLDAARQQARDALAAHEQARRTLEEL